MTKDEFIKQGTSRNILSLIYLSQSTLIINTNVQSYLEVESQSEGSFRANEFLL